MRLHPRHGRFMAAFALGVAAGAASWALAVRPDFALLVAADAFFLIYLLLTARIIGSTNADALRHHAEEDDEGVALILILAALAVLVSVAAIFLVLNANASTLAARSLALVSLPLGWATVHTLAAFHYAHLHYRGKGQGLIFPGKGDPDAWDFLYASFTIGMTAQVSDVEVATRQMRRAVLVHGVASFFYNTCILALAVNAAMKAGQ
jgi:uncharacterized membrane protein